MAGTVSVEYQKHTSVRVAVVTWESDGDGDADGTVVIDGEILKVVTNPGAAAPTADYDITLLDEDGLDVLEGACMNRHTSNSEAAYPFKEVTLGGTGSDAAARPCVAAGPLTFTVANAGATKAGVAKVFYR